MDLSWLTRRPIAHRGLHDVGGGVVENSLGAARRAVARGYSIECDVLLSADGEVVVFHDDRLERLTAAAGRVDQRSLAELRSIVLTGSGETIPSLAELLTVVDGRVGLVVELKSDFPTVPDDRLAERVAVLLADYAGPVVTKSFDPEVVAACNRIMPGIAHGIVADATEEPEWLTRFTDFDRFRLRHLLHAARSQPKFVSYCVDDLPAPGPWVARRLCGLPVISWTVRTAADRARAARWADQIVFEGFDPDTTH